MHTKAEYLRKYDIIATLESPDSNIIVHYQNFGSISKAKKHSRFLQAGNRIGRVRIVDRFPKQPAKTAERGESLCEIEGVPL